jgi:DNA-binding CsgD family transcriptional regulator
VKLTAKQLDKLAERFRLAPRERQLVELLFRGVTDTKAMALEMGISPFTVKVYLRQLYMKTVTSDKAQAMARCLDALSW